MFVTGLGIFVGLICGVIVQVAANWATIRWQTKNAKDVFLCELELNLSEIQPLRDRMRYVRDRVLSGQATEDDLSFLMLDFDYSALHPLVQSGHFHKLLGTAGVKKYLAASKFFNQQNAMNMSSMLQTEHAKDKSVDFLDWMERQVAMHENNFADVQKILAN